MNKKGLGALVLLMLLALSGPKSRVEDTTTRGYVWSAKPFAAGEMWLQGGSTVSGRLFCDSDKTRVFDLDGREFAYGDMWKKLNERLFAKGQINVELKVRGSGVTSIRILPSRRVPGEHGRANQP
jgi:hypothetical protein